MQLRLIFVIATAAGVATVAWGERRVGERGWQLVQVASCRQSQSLSKSNQRFPLVGLTMINDCSADADT